MEQTVIKVGNSLAITLPAGFVKDKNLKAGQKVIVRQDLEVDALIVASLGSPIKKSSGITPEFLDWLEKFNNKYKTALTELAKK
ncbi:MAG: AbrB/MazE/SpoVT family DNA-binding domain-containing protein [Candidatus Levybacteria bacterium]|nr:AbrB/MazE/SpoVT family DNA-binding domain-containing protein [Candidatus Levybacteria bacterium]